MVLFRSSLEAKDCNILTRSFMIDIMLGSDESLVSNISLCGYILLKSLIMFENNNRRISNVCK